MRIAVLWTGLSGYMNACLRELASRDGVSLFVSYQRPAAEAPFEDGQFAWIPQRFSWSSDGDLRKLHSVLREFAPDIIVLPSWHVSGYRRVAKEFRGQSWRVMAMDHPWLGTMRQRIGALISPYYVKPIADAVWLPGERQASFARRLGFPQSAILRGLYACDQASFEAVHNERIRSNLPLPRKFLFVGRMVAEKCVDRLCDAYAEYRRICSNPWPLICCGAGPMRSRLEKQEGIRIEGFVQPPSLPRIYAEAGCLVLPSKFEPWALVVHEATSAGRLILASESVGAVTSLVQSGYNGFIFGNNNTEIALLMNRVSAMPDSVLDRMSQASYSLSRQFSPSRWADTLLGGYSARTT